MADKIVTLKDKNDNNLYPVAGALFQDAVTTASIKDGAVTTAKISNEAVTSAKISFADFIQTGTAQIEYQTNGSAGGFVTVTFSTPFSRPPVVLAQDVSSDGSLSALTVSEVTATGFRLLARTSATASFTRGDIKWIAILI